MASFVRVPAMVPADFARVGEPSWEPFAAVFIGSAQSTRERKRRVGRPLPSGWNPRVQPATTGGARPAHRLRLQHSPRRVSPCSPQWRRSSLCPGGQSATGPVRASPLARAVENVLLPYGSFAAAAVGIQLLLPSQVVPVTGGGPSKTSSTTSCTSATFSPRPSISRLLVDRYSCSTATWPAWRRWGRWVLLAAIGVAARVVHPFEEDVPLAAYLCCMSVVVLIAPQPDGQYLATVTPFLCYFAALGVRSLAEGASAAAGARFSHRGLGGVRRACDPQRPTRAAFH